MDKEINILMYSSLGDALQTLARRLPPKRAEAFLLELLNVRSEDVTSGQRLTTRFSEFIPFALDAGHEKAALRVKKAQRHPRRFTTGAQSQWTAERKFIGARTDPDRATREYAASVNFARLWQWRVFLEDAWKQPTTLAREIAMLRPLYLLLEDFYKVSVAASGKGMPLESARAAYGNLVVATVHALRITDRMRCCGNSACQMGPYFIARRRSQKYCSDVCARPAQREFKASWWKEHGNKWRAKRRAATKRRGKARRKGGKT